MKKIYALMLVFGLVGCGGDSKPTGPGTGGKGGTPPVQDPKKATVPDMKKDGGTEGKKAEGKKDEGKKDEGKKDEGKKDEGKKDEGKKDEGKKDEGKKDEGKKDEGKKDEGKKDGK